MLQNYFRQELVDTEISISFSTFVIFSVKKIEKKKSLTY